MSNDSTFGGLTIPLRFVWERQSLGETSEQDKSWYFAENWKVDNSPTLFHRHDTKV